MKATYHFLESITKESPGTVIDHNWLDIMTDEEPSDRHNNILAELRDITGTETNEDCFNLYEGFTIEEILRGNDEKWKRNSRECLNCGHVFLQIPIKDELGYMCTCPKCKCSFSADRYDEFFNGK